MIRRKTRIVNIGKMKIGGDFPIRVQTMTTTDTLDVLATVKQIRESVSAGAEIIRLAVSTLKAVQAFSKIKEELKKYGLLIPLVADVHFSADIAYECLFVADKIRINPGNFLPVQTKGKAVLDELKYLEENLVPFISATKKAGKTLRIGTNHGSLSERILKKYGNTKEGLVEATMEYLRIFQKNHFSELVVAVKAPDPLIMIEANRLLVKKMSEEEMDYPLHLGVTEAGNADEGRIKSALGIGTLLLDGIGDTIRVSLTEKPQKEVAVAYSILQATGCRITKTEFIACPGCGRTLFDIEKTLNRIKEKLGHLKGIRIAVIGCIINGLGEMGEADFGYVGGKKGKINLYRKKELIKRDIPEEKAVEELEKLIKKSV